MLINLSSNIKSIIVNEENCTGCMICQMKCSFLHFKEFNPSKAFIIIDLTDIIPKIHFLDDCTKCGQCVDHCLYGALEFKEEEI